MNYYLAEACQNTFILLDCIDQKSISKDFLVEVHQKLVEEGCDDALILIDGVEENECLILQMLVLGQDNTFGEFCGNGTRASASYLFERYPQVQKFFLKTAFGYHELKNHQEGVFSINLPLPSFEINPRFVSEDVPNRFRYVEIIEPHLVCEGEITDEELTLLGRQLNQQRTLFPRGINVNAYYVQSDSSLFVKTYERGVQRLTKSCGTGSLSCSFAYKPVGQTEVWTPGGKLEVSFDRGFSYLKGPGTYERRFSQ